jgi:predicted nucleic acid-binding Zn finger protein
MAASAFTTEMRYLGYNIIPGQVSFDIMGQTGKEYTITLYPSNQYKCNCPAWIFHKGGKVDCKHILFLRRKFTLKTYMDFCMHTDKLEIVTSTKSTTLAVPHKTLEGAICEICLEGMEEIQEISYHSGCGIPFHKFCITPWISRNHTCPNCRGDW